MSGGHMSNWYARPPDSEAYLVEIDCYSSSVVDDSPRIYIENSIIEIIFQALGNHFLSNLHDDGFRICVMKDHKHSDKWNFNVIG